MSFDINGTTISRISNNLNINYNSNIVQQFTNDGNLRKTISGGQPMFMVGDTRASWQSLGISTWTKLTFNLISTNYRSCFSTSTNQFTAPETGMYYFTGSTYNYQTTTAYFYPMFMVNDSTVGNRIGGASYRPRGYYVTAGYSFDGDLAEFIYLNAGDYVYYAENSIAVTGYWYPAYSHFAGVFLG